MFEVNDTARLRNDLEVVISTLMLDVDRNKLVVRLEEVLSNYVINRRTETDIENDLQEKIDLFLDARTVEGFSDKTLKGYKIELGLFVKTVDKPVVQVNTSDIRKYLASNSSWMASTVDRKLSALKSFFSWLVDEELLLRNPASKIKPPKKPQRLPKGLTVEELEIVRESCGDLRERAMIEVMYSTGCRLAEVQNMKIADINAQDMSLRVIGKGNKERVVYLSIKCMHHLRKYLNSRSDECEYLFVTDRRPIRKMSDRNIERIIDNIEQRTKISKKLTPHVLRHTKAMVMMENGADIADVQVILGHQEISTTTVYAHVSEERKKEANRKYHVM